MVVVVMALAVVMIVVVMAFMVVMIVVVMAFMGVMIVMVMGVMIVMVMALMIAVVVAFVGMVLVIALGIGYTPARRGRVVNLRGLGCRSQSRWHGQRREYPLHCFGNSSNRPQVYRTSSHTLQLRNQTRQGTKVRRAYLPSRGQSTN